MSEYACIIYCKPDKSKLIVVDRCSLKELVKRMPVACFSVIHDMIELREDESDAELLDKIQKYTDMYTFPDCLDISIKTPEDEKPNKQYSVESFLKQDYYGDFIFGTPDPKLAWNMYSNDLDNLVEEIFEEINPTGPLKVKITVEVLEDDAE